MSISNLSSITAQMQRANQVSQKISERLAVGGTKTFWTEKTNSQIDVSITTSNKIERLEGFKNGNNLVEDRLKSQLLALDNYLKLAEKIKNEFSPGSYTIGEIRPGLVAIKEEILRDFENIGNMVNSISGEYAMGAVATQNPPIKNTTAFAAYSGSATDYSIPISGSVAVYINDEGDSICLSGNDFESEIQSLYQAITKINESVTGTDTASDQASALAANAQKALLEKYYSKLADIQKVTTQDEELSNAIEEAMEIKTSYTEDNVEELLAKLMEANVMEQICQYLFTDQIRKSQNAIRMLDQ